MSARAGQRPGQAGSGNEHYTLTPWPRMLTRLRYRLGSVPTSALSWWPA